MITDKKTLVRMAIDDPIRMGYFNEVLDGTTRIHQLPDRNVWDLVVRDQADVVIDDTTYTVYPVSGQVSSAFTGASSVTFEYKVAGFTDAEIDHFLESNDNNVDRAALAAIDILLASSAKRFDYKAGLKDIKASQVFDQLKELRTTIANKIDESTTGGGPVVLDRQDTNFVSTPPGVIDISRSDA